MMRSRTPIYLGGACAAVLLSMPAMAADVKQAVAGASNSVDSPAIGYVVRLPGAGTATLELRAMLGVPGAARFSDPIALPDGTLAAEVAPGHAWAFVTRSTDAVVYVPSTRTIFPMAGGLPGSWAFSPSGSRMVLFYPDRGEVELVSGLPTGAKVERTLKVAQIDSFAIGDGGGFVYAVGNQLMNSDGGLLYASDGSLGPVAFEMGRDLVVLFDGSTSSLVEVGVGNSSTRVIASGIDIADRLFAGVERIYAGNTAAGTVSLIGYSDGSVATQNVPVSRIGPSAISGTMVVSFDSDGPAWLVNSQGVSFVPAIVKQGVQ